MVLHLWHGAQAAQMVKHDFSSFVDEPLSKLLVSPFITLIVVPYIIPYITPL